MVAKPKRRKGRSEREPWQIEDISRLKALWENRPEGLTQASVAAVMGVDRSLISQFFNGDTALTWKAVLILSAALKVSPDQISPTLARENLPKAIEYKQPGSFERGQESSLREPPAPEYHILQTVKSRYQPTIPAVQVMARVIAGNFRDAIPARDPDDEPWMEHPRYSRPSQQGVWLIVDGDSMDDGTANGFRKGDLILVDPDVAWGPGDYVIIANGSDEWTFKRLRKDGPTWYMEALNPDYRPRVREIPEGWRVVAKVLEVKPQGRKVG